jgi:GT2 family glycosyltransferase
LAAITRLEPSDVAVVVVIHNSGDTVAECLRSIPAEAEVIVVDNASDDEGAEVARAARRGCHVLHRENDGFGAGCNAGAAIAERPMLLFLNPDASLEAGALPQLLAPFADETIGVTGPRLTDGDGRTRHNCRRRSVVWQDVAWLLPFAARWVPERLRRDLAPTSAIYTSGGDVDYLQGACLMVPAALFRRIGGFDIDFFLYEEEEALCEAVRAAGRAVRYCPDAVVRHLETTSIGKRPASFVTAQLFRSRLLLYRKRDGESAGRAAGLLLLTIIAGVAMLSPFALLFPRRHLRSLAWCWAAAMGVADGMLAPISPTRSGPCIPQGA